MRIQTEFEVASTVDATWEALHSPQEAAGLYSPLVQMVAPWGMPDRFQSGDRVIVRMRLFGLVPLGAQLIHIEDEWPGKFAGDPRTMRDQGGPLTGPLVLLESWRHEITIQHSPHHPDRTVWRDELTIGGIAAAAFWPVLELMWRWRQRKLKRISSTWNAR